MPRPGSSKHLSILYHMFWTDYALPDFCGCALSSLVLLIMLDVARGLTQSSRHAAESRPAAASVKGRAARQTHRHRLAEDAQADGADLADHDGLPVAHARRAALLPRALRRPQQGARLRPRLKHHLRPGDEIVTEKSWYLASRTRCQASKRTKRY